jgi:hypothetical protein
MVRLPIVGHRAYDRFGMLIVGYLSAYRSAERTSARFSLPRGLGLPFVAFITLTRSRLLNARHHARSLLPSFFVFNIKLHH